MPKHTTPSSLTRISDAHKEVFRALTSGKYGNFALLSCLVNGEPGSAIVAVIKNDNDDFLDIYPLFVSVTDKMQLTDHEGNAC